MSGAVSPDRPKDWGVFHYDPPASPATIAGWQAELDRITPRSTYAGWLWIGWHPGDPWAPVQRWYIYEMVSPELLGQLAQEATRDGQRLAYQTWWEELHGPNPRERGRYDKVERLYHSHGGQSIDLRSWQLWQETGHWARPYWVVQGPMGGHKRWYDELEERVCAMMGFPGEPPPPGSLPYTEPTADTFHRIAAYDRIRQANDQIKQIRSGRQHRDAKKRLMGSVLRDLFSHIEAVYRDVRVSRDLDDIRRVEGDPINYADMERLQDRFVST